jgi:hypothetical protein
MCEGDEKSRGGGLTPLLNLTAALAWDIPSPHNPATKGKFPAGQAVTREIQLGDLQNV